MPRTITAIIPAAGKPSNHILQNSNLPDAMIPINGKPVIGYALEDLISRGVKDVAIVLNKADVHTEKYVSHKFSERLNVRFVYANHHRGVGYSIFLGAQHLDPAQGVLVYLGDTIFKDKLDLNSNTLVVSDQYENSNKWCFVEQTGNILRFVNKPENYTGSGKILCGVYYFRSGKKFSKSIGVAERLHEHIEVSDILEAYQKQKETFRLVKARKWYDCGNIENYHAARVDFLRLRSFNTLSYNPITGVITKSSSNKEKIRQEVNWLQNVPDDLKTLAPRLIEHSERKDSASYAMEYYGYHSLADIYLHAHHDVAIWRSILRHMFSVIDLFKEHRGKLTLETFSDMYIGKTHKRLDELREKKYWARLLSLPQIEINGTTYKNIDYFLPLLPQRVEALYNKRDITFIHGDLCLSNILYDTSGRLIKLIDPRGHFGSIGVYGDIKYDLAKLRHSFDGHYEFIISDLFKLSEEDLGQFTLQVYADDYHKELASLFDGMLKKAGYAVDDIMLIEALLFISMIPLHNNEPKRQKAMFATGIRLLNHAF